MDGANLLVDGIDAIHQFLYSLRFIRFLDDACFHFSVDLVLRNELEETPHRFVQIFNFLFREMIAIDPGEFLAKGIFEDLLGHLVSDGASDVVLELI